MEALKKLVSKSVTWYRSLSREKRIISIVAAVLIVLSLLRAGTWIASRFNTPTPNKYVKQLKSPNKADRMRAIYAAGAYRTKKAEPLLKNIFERDPDPQLRRMAAVSLGKINQEALAGYLKSPDRAVRFTVMDALMQINKDNLALLLDRFPQEDKEGKLKILGYLEKQPDARYAETMLARVEDTSEDMAVRLRCLEIVKNIGPVDMAARLLNIYYNDTDEGLRKAAYAAVQYMKERAP